MYYFLVDRTVPVFLPSLHSMWTLYSMTLLGITKSSQWISNEDFLFNYNDGT